MKYLISICLSLLVAMSSVQAQKKDTAYNRQIVEDQNFRFVANSASPMRGTMRQLTSEYDLVVNKDSLIAWLPYFGRVYSAPIDPSEGGIRFTSSKFEFMREKKGKHGWEIKIKPTDVRESFEFYLTAYDNGSAVLRVNSVNREGITYNGYITGIKSKENN